MGEESKDSLPGRSDLKFFLLPISIPPLPVSFSEVSIRVYRVREAQRGRKDGEEERGDRSSGAYFLSGAGSLASLREKRYWRCAILEN